MCGAAKSTRSGIYSDEPFTIRDIQFNNPQIGVAIVPPGQIFAKFKWIFSILRPCRSPDPATLGIGNTLKQPRICTLFGQNDQDCTGLAVALVKYSSESTRSLNSADQARHFEVGGQPRDYAASFSIEFDSRA